jgi:hypothetical protein
MKVDMHVARDAIKKIWLLKSSENTTTFTYFIWMIDGMEVTSWFYKKNSS